MNAILNKIENSEAHFEFSIDYSKFDQAVEYVYRKNKKKYQLPGFRKGSVPRAVLEAKYGPEMFYQEALERVVGEDYPKALDQLNLKTIGEPDIEVDHIQKGKDLNVRVVVPVMPEVKLGTLEGLQITLPKTKEVTDNDVEKTLHNLRDQHKKIIDKQDQPAQHGDTLTIDYDCTVGDDYYEPVHDYKMVLGETSLLGFEESLVGVKKGQTLEVDKDYPQDYPLVNFAGKSARFKITVNKVEFIEPRLLNDQFAQEVGQVSTLDELRERIKQDLKAMANQHALVSRNQSLMRALIERCELTVPDSLVMQRAMSMLEQISQEMQAQGGNIDLYLQISGKSKDEFKKQIWNDAQHAIKAEYIIDKIIQEKNFTVSEEELDEGIKRFALTIGMDPENARTNLGPMVAKVEYDLKADKVFQYLFEHAIVTEATDTEAQAQVQAQA